MKLGVLLFNLGGPETLADVRPFLYNLFADPEIIRLPARAMQRPLAWLISTTRARKSSKLYAMIGNGSPLRRITEEQAAELQAELRRRGTEAKVYVGMRYWHPFTKVALDQIEQDGITDLVVLPLYPQFSVSTTGSSTKELVALLNSRGGLRHIRRRYITHWYQNGAYIEALAGMIRTELERFPNRDPRQIHLVFSAHSVPQSYVERGDPYLRQTEETVKLVAQKLGGPYPTHLSFQSKVGPVKWLEPSTEQMLRKLKGEGAEQVLMIPISFVSEHIETLYELDILYKGLADEIGLPVYRRVAAFNTEQAFIRALADLVVMKISSSTER